MVDLEFGCQPNTRGSGLEALVVILLLPLGGPVVAKRWA